MAKWVWHHFTVELFEIYLMCFYKSLFEFEPLSVNIYAIGWKFIHKPYSYPNVENYLMNHQAVKSFSKTKTFWAIYIFVLIYR